MVGGIIKGLGEALQIGAKDLPLAGALGGMLVDLGEMTQNATASLGESFQGLTLGGNGVDFGALGRGISNFTSSLNPGSQEVSQALVRAPEISAPALDQFSVSHADLGNITPTPIGGGSGGKGFGLGA